VAEEVLTLHGNALELIMSFYLNHPWTDSMLCESVQWEKYESLQILLGALRYHLELVTDQERPLRQYMPQCLRDLPVHEYVSMLLEPTAGTARCYPPGERRPCVIRDDSGGGSLDQIGRGIFVSDEGDVVDVLNGAEARLRPGFHLIADVQVVFWLPDDSAFLRVFSHAGRRDVDLAGGRVNGVLFSRKQRIVYFKITFPDRSEIFPFTTSHTEALVPPTEDDRALRALLISRAHYGLYPLVDGDIGDEKMLMSDSKVKQSLNWAPEYCRPGLSASLWVIQDFTEVAVKAHVTNFLREFNSRRGSGRRRMDLRRISSLIQRNVPGSWEELADEFEGGRYSLEMVRQLYSREFS